LNKEIKKIFKNDIIDHLLGLGILTKEVVDSSVFVCIVCEPIERFISIANYENYVNLDEEV